MMVNCSKKHSLKNKSETKVEKKCQAPPSRLGEGGLGGWGHPIIFIAIRQKYLPLAGIAIFFGPRIQ
jgi:hypothetical protein